MNDAITDRPLASEQIPYELAVKNISSKYKSFKQKGLQNEAHAISYEAIAGTMPGYWNGTPWDFNGTTQVPGQGSIACGYFVTTILEDIGYSINRVKLAQQPSSVLINATCTQIKHFANIKESINYISALPDNTICIAGLDFHTGFIIKSKSGAYFFHSNYIRKQGVIKEKLNQSAAFNSSKTCMVGILK